MQKIILDTNVIISALISNSLPTNILFDLVFAKLVNVCLSNEIFTEYLNVLKRDKFLKYNDFQNKANLVINEIKNLAINYTLISRYDVIKDKSDNKFLELASISNADFLITGNINDFQLKEFFSTRIVTPNEYWNNYRPNIIYQN
jgi:putative PIN family toxin of toxin-antitoxin system